MPDNECALGRIDPLQLAWAAGFFDGEGSTVVHECRPGYLRLTVSVPQSGGTEPPEVLIRFKAAMLGLGEIDRINGEGMWAWRSRSAEEAQAAQAFLWTELGTVKRSQAARAISRFRAQYGPGRLRPRAPRRRRPLHVGHSSATSPPVGRPEIDAAWLAGFLDGEGYFGLVRSAGARKSGPDWYRIRASVTQRNELPGPPEVLFRVRSILGMGRIERHGDPRAWKWVIEGPGQIERILSLARGWLGQIKRDQASGALLVFRSQIRLKGNTTHCKRGHQYGHVGTRSNGRIRRICNACVRILARRKRARQGITPRQFKNAARRYTL